MVPIEEIRIGDRVFADSQETERTLNIQTENWLVATFETQSDDEGNTNTIRLLRPIEWFENIRAEQGQWIHVEIAEKAFFYAKLLDIEPCPEIEEEGPGYVVTATFETTGRKVLNLWVENESEPIRVTPDHLLWSATRDRWVQARFLQVDESLETKTGTTKVLSIEPAQTSKVYDIEVETLHQYYITQSEVLSHNENQKLSCQIKPARQKPKSNYGKGRKRGVPHKALKEGDLDQYRYFSKRPNDDLEGHEIWQNANNKDKGLGGRNSTYGKRNPAIAVSNKNHKIINTIQNQMIPNPKNMTPLENIKANIKVLHLAREQGVNISERQINAIARSAIRFYYRMLKDEII